CQPPQSELAAALEQLVDGKVPFEDEVAAIFDLRDGVEARQLYPLALLDGELGPEDQGPIVEPFANDVGAQSVGSGLECSDVVNRQEGIVILAEADLRTIELPLDEVVAVEVICRLEGEEGCDTHHHGAENFIADIEVVVCEAAALAGEDAVVWILGGILRHADPEEVAPSRSNNEVAPSRGGEEIDGVLDGLVGAVVGGFESAVWAMLRVRTVVEAAVGKWSAQPSVEEQK